MKKLLGLLEPLVVFVVVVIGATLFGLAIAYTIMPKPNSEGEQAQAGELIALTGFTEYAPGIYDNGQGVAYLKLEVSSWAKMDNAVAELAEKFRVWREVFPTRQTISVVSITGGRTATDWDTNLIGHMIYYLESP